MKNLILSGGIFHPFAETSASIAGHLEDLGVTSTVVDVRAGFEALENERFDLVTVNALSWSMTQAEKYQPYRADYAFAPSDVQRQALHRHIAEGGGLLGLHTAAICFDTWAEWPDILGVGWIWGRSHHPPPGYVTVSGADGDFDVWDELYCDMDLAPDTQVLATGRTAGIDDAQPILTVTGRSAYLALGHDLTATANAGYRRLLHRAAVLALGREKDASDAAH